MVILRLQSVEDGIVGRLGLGVVVEQQRGLVGAPRLQVIWLVSVLGHFWAKNVKTYGVVGNTPRGDTNTVLDVKARVHRLQIVGVGSALDVKLSDGALRSGGTESLHGVDNIGGGGPAVAVGKVL